MLERVIAQTIRDRDDDGALATLRLLSVLAGFSPRIMVMPAAEIANSATSLRLLQWVATLPTTAAVRICRQSCWYCPVVHLLPAARSPASTTCPHAPHKEATSASTTSSDADPGRLGRATVEDQLCSTSRHERNDVGEAPIEASVRSPTPG